MFWLVALPIKDPTGRNRTWELLQEKTSYGQQLSSNFKLDVPDLRVGTLDTLLALSDDLVKVSNAVEAVVTKIRRTVVDMAGPRAVATLKVENLPVDAYLTRFKWDEPKFPLRRPLRETVDKIGEVMSHIEDDLKVRGGLLGRCAAHGALCVMSSPRVRRLRRRAAAAAAAAGGGGRPGAALGARAANGTSRCRFPRREERSPRPLPPHSPSTGQGRRVQHRQEPAQRGAAQGGRQPGGAGHQHGGQAGAGALLRV
jgi:hypothetical protein